MRCDQCKHWKPEGTEDWEAEGVGFGECLAVRERWRITEDAVAGREWPGGPGVNWDTDEHASAYRKAQRDALIAARAYVQDGSEYRAELFTGPDFFCALFAQAGETRSAETNADSAQPVG